MMWSKVKASLRAAEARTHPDLLVAIGQPSIALPPKTPSIGLPLAATVLFKPPYCLGDVFKIM